MPITPTEQSRAVCLKLPEIGWKEGEKCKGAMNLRGYCESCGTLNPRQSGVPNRRDSFAAAETEGRKFRHDIPPPDLASLAGADALMGALLKAGYKLDQWQAPAGVHFSILREGKLPPTLDEALLPENREQFQFAVDPDWKRAQLAAAYKLLCEGK